MKFSSIAGNSQKLDGGAMFGNAPRAMWSHWAEPDELNRIALACRGLLVEIDNGPKILFETGIGAYMAPKFKDRFGVQEDSHVLLESLAELGLDDADIDHVVLSHLHFDHAGGLLSAWQEGEQPRLLFPNATYHVGAGAWQRARDPHPRDRASFIPELNELLEKSGRLHIVADGETLQFGNLTVHFFISNGHTPGMMCSDLRWDGKRLVFAADLIPGRHWVHVPITMGYDRFPEALIDEKKKLLPELLADDGYLFYTHDSEYALSKLALEKEKNKFFANDAIASLKRVSL